MERESNVSNCFVTFSEEIAQDSSLVFSLLNSQGIRVGYWILYYLVPTLHMRSRTYKT